VLVVQQALEGTQPGKITVLTSNKSMGEVSRVKGILVITEVVLTFLPFTPSPVFVFPERLPIARAPSFLGHKKIIPQKQNVVKFSWGDTP
jgi:hypothetical protein